MLPAAATTLTSSDCDLNRTSLVTVRQCVGSCSRTGESSSCLPRSTRIRHFRVEVELEEEEEEVLSNTMDEEEEEEEGEKVGPPSSEMEYSLPHSRRFRQFLRTGEGGGGRTRSRR